MNPVKPSRRGLLAMGVGAGATTLLPASAIAARSDTSQVPDFSNCRDSIAIVIAATAYHFGLPPETLMVRKKYEGAAKARQIAMYLAWMMTGSRLSEIGRRFGGRDEVSVIVASRCVAKRSFRDDSVKAEVEAIAATCVGPLQRAGVKLALFPMNAERLADRMIHDSSRPVLFRAVRPGSKPGFRLDPPWRTG